MKHKYVSFVSDEHFLMCIEQLHDSYIKAKEKISKRKFYANKIDTIKLTFDTKFNGIDEESIIETEILRQIDKSINNSIGTFHEQILGGVDGFEVGNLSGYDIKAKDNSLFADIKNKHNTMNSSSAEALFQRLARYANDYKKAKCYWVQILAKGSFNERWTGDINGKEYSHSRVFKISGDQFYALLTGKQTALYDLYMALPVAIDDFLKKLNTQTRNAENSALSEVKKETSASKRSILDQITFENYSYYLGFDRL
ncbi:MAG: Eco47II family restriction endonuclease [Salinivirgaceae bacterium]